MIGYIVSSLITIIILIGLFILWNKRNKKIEDLSKEIKENKKAIKLDLNQIKNKFALIKASKKVEIVEEKPKDLKKIKQDLLEIQPINLEDVCKECLIEHKIEIEEYLHHKDDLPLETEESEVDNNTYDIQDVEEEPTKPTIEDIKNLLYQYESNEQYAYHIIEAHPKSKRVEWAKEYLISIGKPYKEPIELSKQEEIIEDTPTPKKKIGEKITIIPKNSNLS